MSYIEQLGKLVGDDPSWSDWSSPTSYGAKAGWKQRPGPYSRVSKENVLRVKFKGATGEPNTNLYLCGLPTSVGATVLTELFSSAGYTVKYTRISPDTRGFGTTSAIVELASVEEATDAITFFNGQAITWPEHQSSDSPAATASSEGVLKVDFMGYDHTPSSNLFVEGLPSSVDTASLNEMFSNAGYTVLRSRITPDTKGRGVTSAMVELGSVEQATEAIMTFSGQVVVAPTEPVTGPASTKLSANNESVLHVKYKGATQEPNSSLYLSGWPSSADEAALIEMFSSAGCTVKRSKITHDYKGFGTTTAIVELASVEEATEAITVFNGQAITGPAHQSSKSPAATADNEAVLKVDFLGYDHTPSSNLFIEGLPSSVDAASLNEMFSNAGYTVQRSRITPDTKGRGVTSAMVELGSVEEATEAITVFSGQAVVAPVKSTSGSSAITKPFAGHGSVLQVKFKGPTGEPNSTLYLSGLPSTIDTAALSEMFSSMGFTVKFSKITPDTRSFGTTTAIVELASTEEATEAITVFNGQAVTAPPQQPWHASTSSASPLATASKHGVLKVDFMGLDHAPSDNLYIEGLPSSVDTASLNEMFSNAGYTVQRSRITPDTKGRGITSAMVQLASVEEATEAITTFSGQAVMAPVETAMWPAASAKASASNESVLQVKFKGATQEPNSSLYLSGLPSSLDEAALIDMFSSAGCTVRFSRITPDTKGFGTTTAIVELASVEEATEALTVFNGQVVTGPAQQPQAAVASRQGTSYAAIPFTKHRSGPYWSDGNESKVQVTVTLKGAAQELENRTPSMMASKGQTGKGRALQSHSTAKQASTAGNWGKLQVNFGGADGSPSTNLYVSGLPAAVDTAALNDIFYKAGFEVQRSKIIPDATGRGGTSAMVQLASVEEATQAIAVFDCEDVVAAILPEEAPARQLQAVVASAPSAWPATTVSNEAVLRVRFKGATQEPNSSLYVGGLPSSVDDAALTEMFSSAGYTIKYSRIAPDTRGFGVTTAIVELASVEEATSAITAFNGQMVTGAVEPPAVTLTPSASPPAQASDYAPVLEVRYAGREQTPSTNVHITGLPVTMDESMLREMFNYLSPPRPIIRAKMIPDTKGTGKAGAIVQLSSKEAAANAIEQLNGQCVELQ